MLPTCPKDINMAAVFFGNRLPDLSKAIGPKDLSKFWLSNISSLQIVFLRA